MKPSNDCLLTGAHELHAVCSKSSKPFCDTYQASKLAETLIDPFHSDVISMDLPASATADQRLQGLYLLVLVEF